MELIKILQQRCDIYSSLMEKLIAANIQVVTTTTDCMARSKLDNLLHDIDADVKKIQELIDKQDKLEQFQ